MKNSFCTILLLLCLELAHGRRGIDGIDYDDNDDYCRYGFFSMKPNTFLTTDECVKLTCDHTITMIIDTCPTFTCKKDEEIVPLLSSLDGPHPQCCPKIICRRRQSEIN